MLKRSDLSRQFELVVQQEIRNHQVSVDATNQAMDTIRRDIEELQLARSKEASALHSIISEQKMTIETLERNVSDQKRKLDSSIEILNIGVDRVDTEIQEVIDGCLKAHRHIEDLKDKIRSLINDQSNFDKLIRSGLKDLRQEMDHGLSRALDIVKVLFKERDDRPSEIVAATCQLEQRIREKEIDVEGIYGEIRAFRRDCFVVEKKIENLYSLVGRLQKKVT